MSKSNNTKYPQDGFKHGNGSKEKLIAIMKTDNEVRKSGHIRKAINHYYNHLVEKGEIKEPVASTGT